MLHAESHVRHVSMNDDIMLVSAEHNIRCYVSAKLANLRNIFTYRHFLENIMVSLNGLVLPAST
jgi:hypothetical protein